MNEKKIKWARDVGDPSATALRAFAQDDIHVHDLCRERGSSVDEISLQSRRRAIAYGRARGNA